MKSDTIFGHLFHIDALAMCEYTTWKLTWSLGLGLYFDFDSKQVSLCSNFDIRYV